MPPVGNQDQTRAPRDQERLGHTERCFGCGPENPASMPLRLRAEGDRVVGQVTFDERQEGAPGYAHGGAIATVLDDALGSVLMLIGRTAVTAKLEIDYRSPALLGRELVVEAWCEQVRRRKFHLRGQMVADGAVIAEARALFVGVGLEHFEASGAPLPPSWRSWDSSR